MRLEVLLSPLWVFLALGVAPSPWTLTGGALLLATLAGLELYNNATDKQREALGLPKLS